MSRLQKYLLLESSLARAASFANAKHTGQYRKGSGAAYITHPRGVFKILRNMGIKDVNILTSAYLHDTLEDTDTSYNEIKLKFNKDVANMVKDVTSNKKELFKVGKEKYLADKLLKLPNPSLTLKLADRLHNLQDFNTMSKDFQKKMFYSTTYILDKLRNGRSLNNTHKKIIRKINAILSTYKG